MPGRWVTVKGHAVYIEDGGKRVAIAKSPGHPNAPHFVVTHTYPPKAYGPYPTSRDASVAAPKVAGKGGYDVVRADTKRQALSVMEDRDRQQSERA